METQSTIREPGPMGPESVPAAAKGRNRPRTALDLACALLLAGALYPAPARADYEWFQKHGTNNWTNYDYMNYARETSLDDWSHQEWGLAVFQSGGTNQKYFLRSVSNWTTTGQCFEIEIGPPYTHASDFVSLRLYFWEDNVSNYTNLLGTGTKGKARLYLRNAHVYFYVAAYGSTNHAGYYVRRMNLGETSCTSGQTALKWLKVINGAQTKG